MDLNIKYKGLVNLVVCCTCLSFQTLTSQAALQTWIREGMEGEGVFSDPDNWITAPTSGVDGFRIDFGSAVIAAVDDGDGNLIPYTYATRGHNFLGNNWGSSEFAQLRITSGGTLATSYMDKSVTPNVAYEFFVGRGLYFGESNQGRLVIEEGGTLALGYHMAVGRNGGHGRVDMTGGVITRPDNLGNIYLGWDGGESHEVESFGEFYQSGGQVNFAGGVVYMGTQGTANRAPSRGLLELSEDAFFQAGSFFAGRQGEGSSGHIELKDNAILQVSTLMLGGDADVWHGSFGTLRMSGQSKVQSTTLTVGNGRANVASVFTQTAGAVSAVNVRIGRNGGTGKYHLSNTATLTGTAGLYVGMGTLRFASGEAIVESGDGELTVRDTSAVKFATGYIGYGANGDVKISGGSAVFTGTLVLGTGLNATDTGTSTVASSHLGNGTVTISAGELIANQIHVGSLVSTSTIGGNGKIVQQAGSVSSSGGSLILGSHSGTGGEYEMSGGALSVGNAAHLIVGRQGTGIFTMTGGEVTINGSMGIGQSTGGVGVVNLSGGRITTQIGTGFYVGEVNEGTLNISGSAEIHINPASANGLTIGRSTSGAKGIVNLDGGLIKVNVVKRTGGTGSLYFNGGTLQASANNANYISGLTGAYVKSGGAIIDTNGFDLGNAQRLLSSDANDGGLLKKGIGTLTLSSFNTYVGKTDVERGNLNLTHLDAISQSKWIEVRQGANLSSSLPAGFNLVSGAIVSGSGSIQGVLNLKSGNHLKVGESSDRRVISSAGDLTGALSVVGDLILNGGSSVWFNLNQVNGSKGLDWDHLDITGALNVENAETSKVNVVISEGVDSGFDQSSDYSWELISSNTFTFDDSVFSLDMSRMSSSYGDGFFDLALTSPNTLSLIYTYVGSVPEPSRMLLTLGAMFALVMRRSRSAF